MPVHVIGQNESGNKALAAQFNPEFSILDDSALEVSFAAEIETVPTMLMLDASGAETARLVGFVKAEWQTLAADLSADQGLESWLWTGRRCRTGVPVVVRCPLTPPMNQAACVSGG